MSDKIPFLNARMQGYTETIFAEMSALATATDSVNLGQGFPDTDGPESIKNAAIKAIHDGHNQYAPGIGVAPLRTAIAQHQRDYYALEFNPDTEILVTAGATEAIAGALLALCEIGDEVVMFEPFYDSYAACVAMAGAVQKVVPLQPPHWSFDPDAFDAALSSRTRMVLLNTPHNPTGKVFSDDELSFIADRCVEHDLIAITDEVYEHLVFAGNHRPLATFPGMRDRTITISSAAKTFSFTGWKVGWACGNASLIAAIKTTKQYLTYTNATPFQFAIAEGLTNETEYLASVASDLGARRDLLSQGLADIGFDVFGSAGTYFLTTDISPLGYSDAMAFCKELPHRCGVVAIPSSIFYLDKQAGRSLVRWTFCKKVETLTEGLKRLQGLVRS